MGRREKRPGDGVRLLDLYCCAGGASVGYHRAGFDVVGADIAPQPHYPFTFIQADALEYLAAHGHEYDAIHASPPCQDHSTLRSRSGDHGTGWMLPAVLDLLPRVADVWVVENVASADMPTDLVLCGSMFDLRVVCRDGTKRQLRRHRRFALSHPVPQPPCTHDGQPIGVYGTGGGGQMTRGYKAHKNEALAVMGIDWMSRAEVSQAIPPAYTEYIGTQLIEALESAA